VSAVPERFARPELAGVWRRARRALSSGGARWAEVRITVPLADDADRRAVAGLLGRPVRPGTASVGVVLADLDAVVRRPGDGWDLRSVVEAIGGPLHDRRAEAAERAAAVAAATDAARAAGPDTPWFAAWLAALVADGTVARLAGRGDAGLIATAARVLAQLPLDGEPLPVVGARLTGDTKALSTGVLPGLVLRGVAVMLDEDRPGDAAARRALWEAVGVVPDDLASQVLVLGLPGRAGAGGLAAWLADAAAAGVPFRVTLHQLTRWTCALARPVDVHVCENPAVLRAATAQLGSGSAPLVCTEGRPSVAAVRLVDQLVASGARLRVRADFDWAGLQIAGGLLGRPGARPWRFGAVDYRAAVARRDRAAVRLTGSPVASPWDAALCEAMVSTGEAVYEEELLDDLVDDLADRSRRAPHS
jgi:uncharacterized protein (TIGR02679 family)